MLYKRYRPNGRRGPRGIDMATSIRLLHRVLASQNCEQAGCLSPAAWIVGVPKSIQFMCKEHTVECMSDQEFWKVRPARNSNRGRTPKTR